MKKITYIVDIEDINNLKEYQRIYSQILNLLEYKLVYFILDLRNINYINHLFIGCLILLFTNFKRKKIKLKINLSDQIKSNMNNTPMEIFLIKFFL